jgi:hypothetical protein
MQGGVLMVASFAIEKVVFNAEKIESRLASIC